MNSFLAALRFLTILPVPGQRGHAPGDLSRSLWSFPLVGLLLGGLTAAIFWAIGPFLPKPIRQGGDAHKIICTTGATALR